MPSCQVFAWTDPLLPPPSPNLSCIHINTAANPSCQASAYTAAIPSCQASPISLQHPQLSCVHGHAAAMPTVEHLQTYLQPCQTVSIINQNGQQVLGQGDSMLEWDCEMLIMAKLQHD